MWSYIETYLVEGSALEQILQFALDLMVLQQDIRGWISILSNSFYLLIDLWMKSIAGLKYIYTWRLNMNLQGCEYTYMNKNWSDSYMKLYYNLILTYILLINVFIKAFWLT